MQRSVTIRVTVESAPTTHCCASRPIPLPLGYRTARRQRRHLGRQRRIAGYLFRQHTAGYPRTARTGDAGFGFNPVFEGLEMRPAQYAVVARLTQAFRRLLPGLRYEAVNRNWEMTDFEHRPHGWLQASFRGRAAIPPGRGSATHALCSGPLPLSRLGDQPA